MQTISQIRIGQLLQQSRHRAKQLGLDPCNLNYVLAHIKPLLAAILDKTTTYLTTHDDAVLSQPQLHQFDLGFKQLLTGKPLAYIIGRQAFWSLEFKVTPDTLIPRPDTEILLETVLNQYGTQQQLTLCDLGTGSGCIAISLKKEKPSWQVTATDYSAAALAVAQYNVDHLKADIRLVHGSWYDALTPQTDAISRFDIIVSNPPYIDDTDPHLDQLTDEPLSALVAPQQGLADLKHIIRFAPDYLTASGALFIEHGYDQAQAVQQLLQQAGFTQIKTSQDYGGNDRITQGVLRSLHGGSS